MTVTAAPTVCAAATVPIWPLCTLSEYVDPTPTKFTFNISLSILKSDLPCISDILFKNIELVDIPTWVDNPTEIAVVIPTGLWIILSTVIKVRIVASLDGTDNVWLVPIPLPLVNDTATPEFAKLFATATLIESLSSLIAKTVDGNKLVTPMPGTVVVAILIADWPVCVYKLIVLQC